MDHTDTAVPSVLQPNSWIDGLVPYPTDTDGSLQTPEIPHTWSNSDSPVEMSSFERTKTKGIHYSIIDQC